MFRSAAKNIRTVRQGVRSFASSSAKRVVTPVTRSKVGAFTTAVVLAGIVFAANQEPSQCFWGASKPNYEQAKKDIIAAIEKEDEKRNDGTSIAPTLIRLAWHASGTYSCHSKTGGSNGATMRFSPEADWGANAGLAGARAFLEAIKNKHGMSYADTWTLAGAVAVEMMGGPTVAWRPGRTDAPSPSNEPDGRLPNADMGCPRATASHLRDIFGKMGFNDQEIVALSGAHALGRCHENASGYWGPWTRAETTFSNEYFRLLLDEKWTVKKTHKGQLWKGPEQYEDASGEIMMLPSDLVLVQDAGFKPWVEKYKNDEALFFQHFAAAFSRLMELGVPFDAK